MGAKRTMKVPEQLHVMLDRADHLRLRQRADALSKKYGFNVSKSALVRKIIQNYLSVSNG